MARNPAWGRDELILALDLYFSRGQLPPSDLEVVALSALLRGLQTDADTGAQFRSPNSVALKLANLAALDPGYGGLGLSHGGSGDRLVWDAYSSRREELVALARSIRGLLETRDPVLWAKEDGEEWALEGRLLYRVHVRRERNRQLADRKRNQRLKETGRLVCEVCGFDFALVYGDLGSGFIECHHNVPLSAQTERRTTLADLTLVCSNCHRMLHRGRPWPSVQRLIELARGS
jgi:5-methylcytosine-specific restriction protein A